MPRVDNGAEGRHIKLNRGGHSRVPSASNLPRASRIEKRRSRTPVPCEDVPASRKLPTASVLTEDVWGGSSKATTRSRLGSVVIPRTTPPVGAEYRYANRTSSSELGLSPDGRSSPSLEMTLYPAGQQSTRCGSGSSVAPNCHAIPGPVHHTPNPAQVGSRKLPSALRSLHLSSVSLTRVRPRYQANDG